MARDVELCVVVSGLSRLFGDDLGGLLEMARVADAAGIDRLILPDHLAIGARTDRYPYGRFPFARDEPWLEPLTALAALAGVTRRVRLATGVLIAPLRPALLLAKTAATLDVLSHGRLELGVGIGWQREEFEAADVPFAGRAARLDDVLGACRALWRDAPASYHSPTVRFQELWCLPHPVQPGGIPLWLGAAPTGRNLARAAALEAGWMPVATPVDALADAVRRLRAACAARGRDPQRVHVCASPQPAHASDGSADLARTLAGVPALREAGVTAASFALARFARGPDEVRPFLERLGRASC